MNYVLGTLVLILLFTNILTLAALFATKRNRDKWYILAGEFSQKIQDKNKQLDQRWEDTLDENRV